MKILDYLKHNRIYLDGGMGTLLQQRGLSSGELPEVWNISHPHTIVDIHRAYYDAGSNVVSTNTFGANGLKFSHRELEDIICAAVDNAKKARELTQNTKEKFIALDVGPLGRLLAPYGDLDFERAVALFSEVVTIGAKCGVDLVFIETMNDSYETKAALLAAKESCDLPVFVSNAYGADAKLMTGASPAAMVAMLEGLGADAIGANCSLGPAQLAPVVEQLLKYSSVPVLLKPNAGLPRVQNGRTVYDVTPEHFGSLMRGYAEAGVSIMGGCCGTTPEYIKATFDNTRDVAPKMPSKKDISLISSYTHALELGKAPLLIGERINPTGKPRIKQALREGDLAYILSEAISQEEAGAHVLDLNVGLPEIDEVATIARVTCEIQAVCDLPLQIDTSSVSAMEAALRRYNGKALINSLSGKQESMDAIFPLMKKYGGVAVALTLDDDGIPATAEGRFEIAKKILDEAKKYGLSKNDLIFDTLTMTVSADQNAAKVTLDALRLIRERLGCNTVLGVSNVSFGLPCRDVLNAYFFTMALHSGLSAAIMNPHSKEMMKAYRAFCALSGFDTSCADYLDFAQKLGEVNTAAVACQNTKRQADGTLYDCIVNGIKDAAYRLTDELLAQKQPLDIVNEHIIPALDTVGRGFEQHTVYLPALLMSAEAAKAAFERIKPELAKNGTRGDRLCIVMATVKGDIHDIGKNIVSLLLQNYGFMVIDLGKDVSPELIVRAALENGADIVGLSALMTTTVPAMEQTIKLLRKQAPTVKIMVGGAVLTEQYANMIGADAYAKDAMGAVRYAESLVT
ncbi:MAG: homocysteine S-methyltransferase family protein [Clostridia bacterium]|nr:homocysteine S-methyltransferase family protein [Clostridia bacterium]